MSIHRSLTSKSKLKRQRNVLTRKERVSKLADLGRWNENESVFGLPTTKVIKIKAGKKKTQKKEEKEGA